jgi:hypothetical protein
MSQIIVLQDRRKRHAYVDDISVLLKTDLKNNNSAHIEKVFEQI